MALDENESKKKATATTSMDQVWTEAMNLFFNEDIKKAYEEADRLTAIIVDSNINTKDKVKILTFVNAAFGKLSFDCMQREEERREFGL